MVTADQILIHAVGDYLLQSDWMASEKTKRHAAAFAHALVYSLPFLLLRPSFQAWLVIVGTHFVIDRYRLARYVVWAKNFLAPRVEVEVEYSLATVTAGGKELYDEKNHIRRWWHSWADCQATGYHKERPVWLAVWLMIFADNILHVIINGAALRWL
jgi:hypothetical protein